MLHAAGCAIALSDIGLWQGHRVWPDRGNTMDNYDDDMMETETDMSLSYIDADTLAIARLVASAEGISLEQALAEELALLEWVAL